jgi:hypothetical protein
MSGYLTPQASQQADFEEIELAVMETERGRQFLQEYARRNRHADTQVLLSALSRIEKSIAIQREPTEIDKFRLDVLEMSRAISRTRAEIASIKPDNVPGGGRILEASGELDSIVAATEHATSDILAAAEKVQEAAWTMREAGGDVGLCDMLDERATEIYTSCSFQDLTAQRIRKVIDALGFLEKRVNAMIDIWEFTDDPQREAAEPPDANAGLVRDPTMSQADVDFVLVDESQMEKTGFIDVPFARAPASELQEIQQSSKDDGVLTVADPAQLVDPVNELDMAAVAQPPIAKALSKHGDQTDPAIGFIDDRGSDDEIESILFAEPPSRASTTVENSPQIDHLRLVTSETEGLEIISKARNGGGLTAEEAARAMDALKKMSVEERTRLFS